MEKLIDLKSASERLGGLSIWTLRAWAYSGRIASVKVSTRLLIPVEEIDRLITEGTRPRRQRSAEASGGAARKSKAPEVALQPDAR